MKNIDLIKGAIDRIFVPGDVVELRVFRTNQGTKAGFYDDPEALARNIAELSGLSEGIYYTLNPVNPDLMARCKNRWKGYMGSGDLTSDKDIVKRRWMIIDLDPVRVSGISSSESEKQAAKDKARAVRTWLTERGFKPPLCGDSGNGYHLLYRIDMPNDVPSRDLLSRCLLALGSKFNDEVVKVDRTMFNASRICKAYGSLAAKGENTKERPHRLSRLLLKDAPDVVEVNDIPLLQALAAEAPAEERKSVGGSKTGKQTTPEKMEEFLGHYGVDHGNALSYEGGYKWILKNCPFNPDHSDTSVLVGLTPVGALWFKCSHDSCADQKWEEFKALLEENSDADKFFFTEKPSNDLSSFAHKWGLPLEDADAAETEIEEVEDIEEPESPKPLASKTWNELATALDEIRIGQEAYENAKGETKFRKVPAFMVEERVHQFVVGTFTQRARLFFDAYPYIYLPAEKAIVKFHEDNEAYSLLGRVRLRRGQPHASLARSNLSLHIMNKGDQTRIEKWGCYRHGAIYVNNGRKGMFKITTGDITEVDNGTDQVYMLAPEVDKWPELSDENVVVMKAMSKQLGTQGMKVSNTPLCHYLNALFEPQNASVEAYHQLFMTRYLSLFLAGYTQLRPICLALGEQNSGKSTLFEKIMWLVMGPNYESEGLPPDTRGLLAAITNNHIKVFDNIDSADVEEQGYSDYFCKAATGGTVSIAQLYQTNVDKTYSLRCDLMFTSRVNPWPAHRTDLSRRTLFFPIRKPRAEEYITVETIKKDMLSQRDNMLLETLVRLQKVLRGLEANKDVNYPPITEMHSYENYTRQAASYEGWGKEMEEIWRSYGADATGRIIEYSPIIDEIRKWLGFPGINNDYPHVGQWIKSSVVYQGIRRLARGQCTWKNESSFGRAVEKHYSALRAVGVNKKQLHGIKLFMFEPTPADLEECKEAYKISGISLLAYEPDDLMEE